MLAVECETTGWAASGTAEISRAQLSLLGKLRATSTSLTLSPRD